MRAWVLSMVVMLATGCGELDELPRGACGNGFVEVGEDCDGPLESGGSCRPPGTLGECRLDCSTDPNACPAGMGCGSDGLCRAPSDRLEPLPTLVSPEPLAKLATGDLDGDRRADLVGTGAHGVVIHHLSPNMAVDERSVSAFVAASELRGTLGELSNDGLTDVVVPSGLGFVVRLGAHDRAANVTAHAVTTLAPIVEDAGILFVDVFPDLPGAEALILGTLSGVSGLAYFDLSSGVQGQVEILTLLPASIEQAIAPVLAGQIDESAASPCEEIVVAYEGSSELLVFSPCRPGAAGIELNTQGAKRVLMLPAGRVATTSSALLDINADGHLDVAVCSRSGQIHEISLAYGVGDGSFHSALPVPVQMGDDQLGTAVVLGDLPALVIGDLDADGSIDWVSPRSVRVGGKEVFLNAGADWTRAGMGRFNDTAGVDVVAIRETEVQFIASASEGLFTGHTLAAVGPVGRMAIGDFDGDLIDDVVVSANVEPSVDALAIAFGTAIGAPSALQGVGQMEPISQVAVGRVPAGVGFVDGASDMALVARAPSGQLGIALVAGTSTRDLRAPFGFSVVDPAAGLITGYLPERMAIAELDGDGHQDIAALTIRIGQADERRLFLATVRDRARLDATRSAPTAPLPAEVDWSRTALLPVDLEGDGIAEIVLLGPAPDGSRGRLGVARSISPDGEVRELALDPFRDIDVAVCTDPADVAPCGAVAFDFDGDGATDVVAIGRAPTGEPVAVVLWNEGGTLGDPEVLAGPPGAQSIALAAPGAVVLAGGALYALAFSGRAAVFTPLSGVAASPATRIACGDFDGDGVSDVALGSPAGVVVHRHLPELD